jgi:hypothetical protein
MLLPKENMKECEDMEISIALEFGLCGSNTFLFPIFEVSLQNRRKFGKGNAKCTTESATK